MYQDGSKREWICSYHSYSDPIGFGMCCWEGLGEILHLHMLIVVVFLFLHDTRMFEVHLQRISIGHRLHDYDWNTCTGFNSDLA